MVQCSRRNRPRHGDWETKAQALQRAALSVARAGGPRLYDDLIPALAECLGVGLAFVAIFADDARSILRTLSFVLRGQVHPNFEYELAGTACEEVVGREFRYVPRGVAVRFPPDSLFAAEGLDSYAAYPLADSSGTPLGLLVAMDREPIADPQLSEAVLKIFAVRIAAEIERERADIALRAREAQLRQAQKMEAIGQLTGGIAHDFNNILTSVMGYLVLAAERPAVREDARLCRHLRQAELAAQRARDLIAQMLTFARRQHGQRRVLALAPLVRQSMQLLRATLPSSIALEGSVGAAGMDDPVAPVQADPVQLEQVLFNLCINARDAIAGAGSIRIAVADAAWPDAHCASCRAPLGAEHWVELSVTDSGSGIAGEVLERMFDPFYSTKAAGQGSGMGLAMVHGIVHEHGGHVVVDTEPGKGSVFRVLLPPARGTPERVARTLRASTSAIGVPMRGRVLVVEDQPMVAEFIAELLQSWGLDTLVSHDPAEAFQWLADGGERIDAMVTDQTMPGMTGMALAREAGGLRPGMPVILCTGDPAQFDDDELRRHGVLTVLRKPLVSEGLKLALRQALG